MKGCPRCNSDNEGSNIKRRCPQCKIEVPPISRGEFITLIVFAVIFGLAGFSEFFMHGH